MNKYILISLVSFFLTSHSFAAGFTQSDIIPNTGTDALASGETGTNLLDAVLLYVKDSIFALMAVIAVGVFLYIGWKLVIARGNPEEFKKALTTFLYAVIGIFVVAFAWAAVRLVAGLNF